MAHRPIPLARRLFALATLAVFSTPALAQYGGAELDAPWRAQAQVMIDQNRKADLTINLFDLSGAPISGAQVHVVQTRQAYQFGSAAAVGQILGTSANDIKYRQVFNELFNTATIENSLKWVAIEGEFGPNFSLNRAIQTLDYLNGQGIQNRGHALVWPGFSNMPNFVEALQNDPVALRQAIYDHIDEVVAAVEGKVVEWDVINEPRTNNDLQQIFGNQILTDIFNRTAAVTDAEMFINEFNIITEDGNFFTRQQYLNTINTLLNNGVDLGGIGMQGHFNANSLTDIDDVWSILDQFGATGVPITITEFDINSTNETLKANYLRDFLTAVFAHPDTEGFMLWGFWEGRHWRPDAAIFNFDWSETPSVQVWRDLVLNEFMTDEILGTDAAGLAQLRAFHGEHTIEITIDGQVFTQNITLTPDGQILDITLPITGTLIGDLDGDGFVGISDLNLVLGNWNTNVTAGDPLLGDPSGDGFVGIEDLNLVLGNWNIGSPPASVVPEPAGLTLLGLAALTMLTRRHANAASI